MALLAWEGSLELQKLRQALNCHVTLKFVSTQKLFGMKKNTSTKLLHTCYKIGV